MNAIANLLVALVAVLHLYFLVLEMFLWTKPLGLKTFRSTPEKAAIVAISWLKMWARCSQITSCPWWV